MTGDKLAGGRVDQHKIGAEHFSEVFHSDTPLHHTPYPTLIAIAEWLGEPYDCRSICDAVARSSNLHLVAREHESGVVGLSPIGILILTYEVEPHIPDEMRARADSTTRRLLMQPEAQLRNALASLRRLHRRISF